MKTDFIISTTNNIEGGNIRKYVDVVCVNVVVGTNLFSDFAASFTDFFGGKSATYKKKLELIYSEAKKELQQKALRIGANAIIGFKVDFDEISGKDKSMFMVSASGTACVITYASKQTDLDAYKTVSQDDLDKELERKNIISNLKNGNDLRNEWIQFLTENPQEELIEPLLDLYVKYNGDGFKGELAHNAENVLSVYPSTMLISPIYKKYSVTKDDSILSLIKSLSLFDAESVYGICKSDIHLGIKLLNSKTEYYTNNGLDTMKEIYNLLTNLPDTGRIETVKSGIFGKEQPKFICEHQHRNAPDAEFCETCQINIKGLTPDEVNEIQKFKEKIDVISKLLQS